MSYIPAIITASVAFLAAIIAQVVNNYFVISRDNKNYHKQIHSNLISNYLANILRNIYLYNKPFDEKNNIFPDLHNTILLMEKDLKYFNPKLQSRYSIYTVNRFLSDANSNIEKRLEFEIAFYFLQYAKEIFIKSNIQTEEDFIEMLNYAAKNFAYLAICTELEGYNIAKNNLISINQFSIDVLEVYTIEELSNIMNDYENQLAEILILQVENEIKSVLA
ncbi:hypothetical protein [Sporosarcina sp. D27]|uniref:hypothetical protein n=1 Tax=Sporosarcina sp. D27 TaxID=1382305 RepID=UPI000471DD6D|nr:hypothetical protein [Sporosarcina sp. D27]